jgi:2-hydroxychromene-2-carboxylate isomerase
MKRITFYLDFISPYAYLAFERLPQVLAGLSCEVRYQPVLLAGMLSHFGQKGPAEIEPKRAWTFRHVAWLAHQHGVPLQVPAEHPFNPLPLLRLALAASAPDHTPNRLPNRWTCEQIFHHVWRSEAGTQDVNDPERLAALTARLADSMAQRGHAMADPQGEPIKNALKQATQEAIAQGVFGVPHVEAGGRLYFGLEGLDLLSAALRGEPWFNSGVWDGAAVARPGVSR